jgi:hypothetical protein
MTLERMIKRMTITTPSGGRFNIGKVSITVSYCSDFWEWEYLGETYWDVQDLAEAIDCGTAAIPQRRPLWSKCSKVQEKTVKSKHPVMVSFLDARRILSGAIPVPRPLAMGPTPRHASVSESSTASIGPFAWSARTSDNSIVIPCATPFDTAVTQNTTPTFSLMQGAQP